MQHSDCRADYLLFVPPDLVWFDGHFDDTPVIPGVVLVHWASQFAATVFERCRFTGEARQLKFRRLLLPGVTLTLNLTIDREKGQLGFTFHSAHGEHCSGSLLLAA